MPVLVYIVAGALLLSVALASTAIQRLPLSTSLLYLAVGWLLGRFAFGHFDAAAHGGVLEHLTEVAVITSLFSSGLKLRRPVRDPAWRLPVRLATGAMLVCVAAIAVAGHVLFGLSPGLAVLLGAVLAPTDPVLASEVQVESPADRDRLRFALTGEAGLNDGTAFPFVVLGLGLLGHHPLGEFGWRWLAVDVVWAVGAGLAIGWGLGVGVGRLVLRLRREHREALGLDDFLALGLIALAYGLALAVHAYGFLAVFAAGLSLRRLEARASADREAPAELGHALEHDVDEVAADRRTAHTYMAFAVLGVAEQRERFAEVVLMLLVGWLLVSRGLTVEGAVVAALLVVVVRPVAVWLTIRRRKSGPDTPPDTVTPVQRRLVAWFGIRGIGSLYYLFYARTHGLAAADGDRLLDIVLTVVALSVVVHGVSASPLMRRYAARRTAVA